MVAPRAHATCGPATKPGVLGGQGIRLSPSPPGFLVVRSGRKAELLLDLGQRDAAVLAVALIGLLEQTPKHRTASDGVVLPFLVRKDAEQGHGPASACDYDIPRPAFRVYSDSEAVASCISAGPRSDEE